MRAFEKIVRLVRTTGYVRRRCKLEEREIDGHLAAIDGPVFALMQFA